MQLALEEVHDQISEPELQKDVRADVTRLVIDLAEVLLPAA